ncbi:MAG: flagellar hook-length control protein FliK [Rhizobiaceae bacterium]
MTQGVKFVGHGAGMTAGVQAGEGGTHSKRKGDGGAFDALFRTSAKHARAERGEAAALRGKAAAEPAALPLRARLEAAIAATDGARRSGGDDEKDARLTGPKAKVEPELEADQDKPRTDDEADAATLALFALADMRKPTPPETVKPVPTHTEAADANAAPVEQAETETADAPVLDVKRDAKTVPEQGRRPAPAKTAEAVVEAKATRVAAEHGAAPPVAANTNATASPAGSTPAAVAGTDSAAGAVAGVTARGGSGSSANAGGDARGDDAGSRRGRDGTAPTANAKVTAEQSIPAPAMPLSTTGAALVSGLTSDSGWQNSLRSVAAAQHLANQMSNAPMHSMTLQLHPAELGMVTANLRIAGGQLNVELSVENRDAYDRLKGDAETIVKSLKALGYDIDQVTVQQPQIANNTTGRAEQNFSATGSSARDPQAFGSNGQGGNGERLGGQGGGRGQDSSNGRGDGNAQTAQDRAQRGIYI